MNFTQESSNLGNLGNDQLSRYKGGAYQGTM